MRDFDAFLETFWGLLGGSWWPYGDSWGVVLGILGRVYEEDDMKHFFPKIVENNRKHLLLNMAEGLEPHVVPLYRCSGASVVMILA